MMSDILVPLGALAMLAFMTAQIAQLFSNISLNRTLREALRNHPEAVASLAGKLGGRQSQGDALVGWIFIAFAVGLVLMGLLEPGEKRQVIQAAIVPLIVGIVVLGYARLAKRNGQ